jgi:O-antigen/teichoic acid export membrane protein
MTASTDVTSALPVPGRTKRNFAYNVLGSAIPIASALITVPLYLHYIGTARYGVVAIAWLLLGYFGFLDFGLSRASANALSRLAHDPDRQRGRVLVTSTYLNLGLGAVGGVVLYVASDFLLLHEFKIPAGLLAELRPALPWMAAMLPLGMVAGVANGALESRERFLICSLLSGFGTVLGQVLPLGCVYLFGPSLAVVIPAILLSRLTTVIIGFAIVVRIEWPISPFGFDRSWVRRLFGYGVWVSVSSIVSPVLESFDQMLIGSMLGASAIAQYSIPMNLTMRSQIFASSLARTLFPRLSRESASDAKATMELAMFTLAYGFAAMIAPAILLSGPFFKLWVGAAVAAVSTPVAQILLIGAWANGVAFLPFALLQGQGRPDITAKIHLIEVVPFIGLLWLLMRHFGLPGAAVAWSVRVCVDCLLLGVVSRCSTRSLMSLLLPFLMLLGCGFAGAADLTLTADLLLAALSGGLMAVLTVCQDPHLRQRVLHALAPQRRLHSS